MVRSLCGLVLFVALGFSGLQKEADAADYFVQYPMYSYGYPTYPSTVYAPTTSYYGGYGYGGYGYSVYRPAVPTYRPAPVYRWGVNRPIISAPVITPSVPVYVPNTYFYVR